MALEPAAVAAAVAEIEAAFAGLTPPGDAKLLHPQCCDDGDVMDFYGAPAAASLSDETIVRNYAASSFFSAEAFRYYMPAFMLWALRHCDSIEYAPEATLRAFDPDSAGPELRAFQLSKFARFSEPERRAVVHFLKAFAAHPHLGPLAEAALANHWHRYDPAVTPGGLG